MSKSIYAYAWDLAEIGLDPARDEFLALGLDTVTLAGTYHAGKFLRPHGKAGKVYFRKTARPISAPIRRSMARSGRSPTVLSPSATSCANSPNSTASRPRSGWCCCTIRRQGMAHPDSVVHNAFGDPYFYNLCPSAPKARICRGARPGRDQSLCGYRS